MSTLNIFVIGLLILSGLFTIAIICYIAYENRKYKHLYAKDNESGSIYKGYMLRNGKVVMVPARVQEEYMKKAWGAVRLPNLDITIQ